ncbi:unnamed protein product [Lactuca saligna]|uniref:Non-specific lipid-transfer protein n=1 Tax=Lactuca saligna TaxID=75948 RepID=A0AA35ZZ99_LACSI|nr:unnamed protein product [Lactuca saligna]
MITLKILPVACMVVSAPYAEAAITCGQVVSKMLPCLAYVRTGGAVPAPCCSGLKSLKVATQATPDLKTACGCLKTAYTQYAGINPSIAVGLPAKCGVNFPFKFSPDIDCSKLH